MLRLRVLALSWVFVEQVLYTYRDAQRWCLQLAEGVAYLHRQIPLIIHRDLKLDNILLTGAAPGDGAQGLGLGLVGSGRVRSMRTYRASPAGVRERGGFYRP